MKMELSLGPFLWRKKLQLKKLRIIRNTSPLNRRQTMDVSAAFRHLNSICNPQSLESFSNFGSVLAVILIPLLIFVGLGIGLLLFLLARWRKQKEGPPKRKEVEESVVEKGLGTQGPEGQEGTSQHQGAITIEEVPLDEGGVSINSSMEPKEKQPEEKQPKEKQPEKKQPEEKQPKEKQPEEDQDEHSISGETESEEDDTPSTIDYDAIYEKYEQDIGGTKKEFGNLLMNLKKGALPMVILERRSLLEVYADFFAHPDDFISAVNEDSAETRFLAVLKYYLNSFFPARKSSVVKKPYNPILGETFRCRWTLPGTVPSSNSRTKSGPFPGSAINQVTFIAEQVSHHPPISAFYVEHPEAGISCTTHIYTKSSVHSTTIGLQMVGRATIKIHKNNETYTATFPDGYGHAVMVTTPWFELAGKVELRCKQTDYRAEIDFQAKPLLRGKAHQIHGQIFRRKSAVMHLKGEWNGHIFLKRNGANEYHLFTDVRQKPEVRKECEPVLEQEDRESRKLWRHVTASLFSNNIEVAFQAKRCIEQQQRDEQAHRDRLGRQWKPRHFVRIGDGSPSDAWRYCDALEHRLDGP